MVSWASSRMRPTKSRSSIARFAKATSRWAGRPIAFLVAAGLVLAWLASGPLFDFSNGWQLTINSVTAIVTFLMVFLIQNAQYRDAEAVQVKLDELLRVTSGAHNALLDLEEMEEAELDQIRKGYADLAKRAREELRRGGSDTGAPELADR